MAEYYYLVSQLPSLDGISESVPLPISEDRLIDLCESFLNKKALNELQGLTLIPPMESERSSSALIEKWNVGERNLRLALSKFRAEKLNKPFELRKKDIPAELFKIANTAVEMENPLDAERFLLQYRLTFLETLRPMNGFSEEYIFYYALKLKLILRIRRFDKDVGETVYKSIYNSILDGDSLEDK